MNKSDNETDCKRSQEYENYRIFLVKELCEFDGKDEIKISYHGNGKYYAQKGNTTYPLKSDDLEMLFKYSSQFEHLVPKSHLESEVNYSFFRKLFLTKKNRIKNPPASFLLKIADLLPKKYSENLKQEVSDLRLEYNEALSEKKIWRARFIASFYYIGLTWAAVMWISEKVKKVIEIIPKAD